LEATSFLKQDRILLVKFGHFALRAIGTRTRKCPNSRSRIESCWVGYSETIIADEPDKEGTTWIG